MTATRTCLFFATLWLKTTLLFAQLDTIHWLPPMHARVEWGPSFLYLTTPEQQDFEVEVRNGAGYLLAKTLISNTKPFRFDLGNYEDSQIMAPEDSLHKVLHIKGLVIKGAKKFYASFRVVASSTRHAGDLTCKGRAALGQSFRIGHVLQAPDEMGLRSNFIGVMASEDNTDIRLSDFAPGTYFRIGDRDVQINGQANFNLDKGQSIVFSQYISNNFNQPPNGFMGALLESDKPIAVNAGSWLGAPVQQQAYDIGIDQIAPFEQVGKEYILCKGNGGSTLEHPIIIAHANNTSIWLNGEANPTAVLKAGQYLVVGTERYTSAGNMYVRSSEPVFLYQMIGGTTIGGDEMRTAGLMFVPPVSCAIPNAVDNIMEPNHIGSIGFEGGLMIVAMRDSSITVRLDGVPIDIGPGSTVSGNPDFVTYRNLSLFSQGDNLKTISVVSQGAVQVAMYGRNAPASFAAFYSGFSKIDRPKIELRLVGDGVCPDTLYTSGKFDGVQWMLGDSVLQFGKDTSLVALTPGLYTAVGYLGVCRRTDFASDSLPVTFRSPEFPYAVEEPSCFGYSDGAIAFGAPYGGFPPYEFSVDRGAHFSKNNRFGALHAGPYQLVVRDSTGCYNRPLSTVVGQPDSLSVRLFVRQIPDHLKPGGLVTLEALPKHDVARAVWQPEDSSGCYNCLLHQFRPQQSSWVSVIVYDEHGCPATDSLRVLVEPNVFAPNAIRPEGEGANAYFTLYGPEPLPLRRLQVFDRWGELVFDQRDILTNTPHDGWDGSRGGKKALPGVYVFVAELEILPGQIVQLKGEFVVVW